MKRKKGWTIEIPAARIRTFSSFPIVIIGKEICVKHFSHLLALNRLEANEATVFDVIEQDGVEIFFVLARCYAEFFAFASRDRIWLQHSYSESVTQPQVSSMFYVGKLFIRPHNNNKILRYDSCHSSINVVKPEFAV